MPPDTVRPLESLDEGETVDLIRSAVHDNNPRLSLPQIYHAISNATNNLLDPLNALPILLLSRDPVARDWILLMSESSSAKEVLIEVQAAVEQLNHNMLLVDDDDDDDDDNKLQTPSAQLVTLVSLYSSVIPRLKPGKKPPSEFFRSLFSELESTIQLVQGQPTRDEGRELITSVSHLVQSAFGWVKAIAGSSGDEIRNCQGILRWLLDSTIEACASSIHSSLAQRSFERCFPRLTIRTAVEVGWEEGERAMCAVKDALGALGMTSHDIPVQPTVSSLVLLAHLPSPLPASRLLFPLLPALLTSVQLNVALDESLSLLLNSLYSSQSQSPKNDFSPDFIIPLFSALPPLASAHPDPSTRHLIFRILSLLLSLTPSALRLQLLKDITSNTEFPQMCVAATGLAKEAVFDALSVSSPNIFASPHFLQVFGPVLFRPRPQDLFLQPLTAQEFQKSSEAPRLVESLGLYYTLLLRDNHNRTGVRDHGNVSNIENSLLGPLRLSLARWINEEDIANGHLESIVPSLQTSLERVDGAILALELGNSILEIPVAHERTID